MILFLFVKSHMKLIKRLIYIFKSLYNDKTHVLIYNNLLFNI